MNLNQFLSDISDQGVKLWVEGEQLRVNAPKGFITPEIRELLVKHKAELIPLLQQQNRSTTDSELTITKVDTHALRESDNKKIVPLSFPQERIWFLSQLEPDNPFYNEQSALKLHGSLNIMALEQSINKIIDRHEILRTNFQILDEAPIQVIAENLTLNIPVLDLTGIPEIEKENTIQQLVKTEVSQPFDLPNSPLIRVTLLKLTELEHILLLTIHHIIFDGWSFGIFMQELATIYSAFCNNVSPKLPELPIQYADFAVWQKHYFQTEELQNQLNYWKQQLENCPPLLELPTDRPRPAIQTYQGIRKYLELPIDLSEAVVNLSKRAGVTLFMTLFAAFVILLYRYTNSDRIAIGTPIANRNRLELEQLIGFFVNTLVLDTDLSGNPNFLELLNRVQKVSLGAYANQDLPFEILVETLRPERNLSHAPLFQVMFILQNAPLQEIEVFGLKVSSMPVESVVSKFDLTLSMQNTTNGLVGLWEYNTDLFDDSTIERMMDHFLTLLAAIVADPQTPISQLPILTAAEQQQLLVEWNNTQTDYPTDKCLHQLFEAQVEKTPDAVAVVFENQQFTYQELNLRANQLANYLRSLGVSADVPVGICVERSLLMMVGILGILKAGGAYVPLDPEYPTQRLDFMLTDSSVAVLLTQQGLVDRLPKHQAQTVCLDLDWQVISGFNQENPATNVHLNNLAYVIYTSGSTGQPKGVAMNHLPLVNLMIWQQQHTTISPGGKTLQFAPISFDVSCQEMFSTWCDGGTLVLISEQLRRDPVALLGLLQEQAVERLFLPFVGLQQLAEVGMDSTSVLQLREIVTAGEQLQMTPAITRWLNQLRNCTLHNHYGPSESHVVTSFTLSDSIANRSLLPPIGCPIANSQIYILDSYLQPVPVGVSGELHIGGVGLARGYLNRPELTIEKFIPNPFSSEPDSRLYKTGDKARYLPDGNIEYLGRIDNQVKIRGFRIELGEIEAILGQYPQVKAAVVIVREDNLGDKRLVAYLVSDSEITPTTNELRQYLKALLPEYMVPSTFIFLETLPLTPNGKVDRRALPTPELNNAPTENYVAPRTPIEEILSHLFSQVLKLNQIGINDNFFEIGGHSLLATQLISRIRTHLQIELPLR
ncbi:amino acid adenylation domain-containing protein, partial [Floridanema evergladense]